VERRARTLASRRARAWLAVALCGLAAVAAGLVALLAPGISRSKRRHAAAAARLDASVLAALERRAAVEQRLRVAVVRPAGRAALVVALQRSVEADARARVRAGTLTGPVMAVRCSPYPPGTIVPAGARIGSYACLVVNRQVIGAGGHVVGFFGDPFWARVDFARGLLAWCKVNPRPGEGGAGTGPPPVPLAPACDLEQAPPPGL
jgi:hypothetical protein